MLSVRVVAPEAVTVDGMLLDLTTIARRRGWCVGLRAVVRIRAGAVPRPRGGTVCAEAGDIVRVGFACVGFAC